jgi:hypothetical protein
MTLSVATNGAPIHYTTDGTTPMSSSPVYSVPLVITCTTTIRAMATVSGMIDIDVSSATFTLQAAAPPGGSYRMLLPWWAARKIGHTGGFWNSGEREIP